MKVREQHRTKNTASSTVLRTAFFIGLASATQTSSSSVASNLRKVGLNFEEVTCHNGSHLAMDFPSIDAGPPMLATSSRGTWNLILGTVDFLRDRFTCPSSSLLK